MSSVIKICGLSTARTLDAALDAGADVVGFVFFEKSPRHLSLDQAGALAQQARGRAQIAVLTVDASDEALRAIIAAVAPDFLQLHGHEIPQRLADLRRTFGLPMIKAIGVSGAGDIAAAQNYADMADRLLFDAKAPRDARHPGGNGVAFDWQLLAGLDLPKPWLLSGGLDPENVAQAIAITGARGVDVSSGVESAPGAKDIGKIGAFIAEARAAFSRAEAANRMTARPTAQPGRVA
ncbi:phosphoribosylanthranilate isomerase [Methylocapsa sp. S129]|uniref:phosphoribosylanthranilate isomerase n=1 Tax=Methylocapsa sp. S129 TaxID=1641869 RepID=UPI00131BE28D|nr:phosphoribosylanthranilate isomerase [Methylocapsa sp. S129]